jgi:hypothetical protein
MLRQGLAGSVRQTAIWGNGGLRALNKEGSLTTGQWNFGLAFERIVLDTLG